MDKTTAAFLNSPGYVKFFKACIAGSNARATNVRMIRSSAMRTFNLPDPGNDLASDILDAIERA